MTSRTRTWVTVLVAVLVLMAICGVAVIGGIAYIVTSHFQSEVVDVQPARERFAAARHRFGGQQPLVQITGAHDAVVRQDIRTPDAGTPPKLTSMRALIYDPDHNRLVDVTLPFWLLRLAPDSSDWSFVSDQGIDFDSKRIHLTAE